VVRVAVVARAILLAAMEDRAVVVSMLQVAQVIPQQLPHLRAIPAVEVGL
jgi:hypothetical protein